jgi:hypothetical protein
MSLKTFVLIHQHMPAECSIAYAAWSGFASPLRGRTVQSTCARYRSASPPGAAARPPRHEIWWTAEAEDVESALIQLPAYVRDRTQAREVSEMTIT